MILYSYCYLITKIYSFVGDNGNILEDTMLIARDDGVVEWNASMTLTSWCDAHDTTMWPRDFHKCNLVLGFEMEFDKTTMRFNENDSTVVSWCLFNNLTEEDNIIF